MGAHNNNHVQDELATINAQPSSAAARSELNKIQEQGEVAYIVKQLQATRENMNKKLKVLENARFRAESEFEQGRDALHKLLVEKSTLEQDHKAAKLRALETAACCQEVRERTKATRAQVMFYKRQSKLLRKAIVSKEQRVAKLHDDVKQGKSVLEQLEAEWKQGEKKNEELRAKGIALRRERERIEASAKAEENAILEEAEENIRRMTDHIEKLTEEITQLELKAPSSRIAARRGGCDKLCTLCLSEEVSVVFVPCGHQVVCATCSALHEMQEVDCPACGSYISQRVTARPASS